MPDYGIDFFVVYGDDNAMDIDLYNDLDPSDPRVVLQAAIAKIFAHDETGARLLGFTTADYYWAPQFGCNAPSAAGEVYDPEALRNLESEITRQALTDPRITAFDVSVDYAPGNGRLNIRAIATIDNRVVERSLSL